MVIETFPVFGRFWEEIRHTGFWAEGFEEAVEDVTPVDSGGVRPLAD